MAYPLREKRSCLGSYSGARADRSARCRISGRSRTLGNETYRSSMKKPVRKNMVLLSKQFLKYLPSTIKQPSTRDLYIICDSRNSRFRYCKRLLIIGHLYRVVPLFSLTTNVNNNRLYLRVAPVSARIGHPGITCSENSNDQKIR